MERALVPPLQSDTRLSFTQTSVYERANLKQQALGIAST